MSKGTRMINLQKSFPLSNLAIRLMLWNNLLIKQLHPHLSGQGLAVICFDKAWPVTENRAVKQRWHLHSFISLLHKHQLGLVILGVSVILCLEMLLLQLFLWCQDLSGFLTNLILFEYGISFSLSFSLCPLKIKSLCRRTALSSEFI